MREFVAWGKRPLKDIGVQKTDFDSIALKENIALSMADILTFNSSLFVKNYGRATLSTVAFRGTSPSHTQVTWNGMRINSPMLGMTDFSTIPAFFIDRATLLHGTSSVNESAGGLGGLVKLETGSDSVSGFKARYIQGIGSFRTFDEFARLAYGSSRWGASTRIACSTSPNDYPFINHDRKINLYDENRNIIAQYHPRERNRNGTYKDFHLLQELWYNAGQGNRLGISLWYMNSNRELSMLTTDYGNDHDFENRQREQTLRGVVSWERKRKNLKTTAACGYIHSRMAYDYKREIAPNKMASMTRARSRINTFYGNYNCEYYPSRQWRLAANITAHQQFVHSEDKSILLQNGNKAIVGYRQSRIELSASASAGWQPIEPIGLSVVVRQEMFGTARAPAIPALFIDCLLSKTGNIMLKASASRNHKFPSLNDLYFLPGGNPELKSEHGWTYDAGLSFNASSIAKFPALISGGMTWFDSRIDDWIIWLPTTKGFFSPRNVKKVHAFGIESNLNVKLELFNTLTIDFNGSYSWTPSINKGSPMSAADQSVGKQLPYVPVHSASLTARLTWRSWSFLYKWAHYSERFTMSSNDYSLTGHLPPYFMSNISLEKSLAFKSFELKLKLAINNLFNEDYLSVLSRPMPGINFEFFVGLAF